ncbi:hypothetical protein C0995_005281 [Termitomyces sp. Mi166|nr:hypothetical protein C0995_005281 [Termitomyces sp. Mi166\
MRLPYLLSLLVMVCYTNSAAINDSHRLGSNLRSNESDPREQEQPVSKVIQHQSENRFWQNRPFLHRAPSPVAQRSLSASSTTPVGPVDARPTPDPTGDPSSSTTVHLNNEWDFSILLPGNPGGKLTPHYIIYDYLVTLDQSLSAMRKWVMPWHTARLNQTPPTATGNDFQKVTGCLNPTKFHLDPSDDGGQFDVRYPNGAQCTYGGYGASFIELITADTIARRLQGRTEVKSLLYPLLRLAQ